MTRLSEPSIQLTRQAPGPARATDTQTLVQEARRLRSETLARLVGTAGNATVASRGTARRPFGLQALVQAWRRRRTIAELSKLSDRMLADIGLTRGEIYSVADTLTARGDHTEPAGKRKGLFAAMRQARLRRATIRELEQLPDRILADIGISRSQIPTVVDDVLARRNGERVDGEPSESPVHGLLHRLEGAVRPLRQWHVSRLAAGQIARLGSATLSDLGYLKGDVDWVPEVLARRKIANSTNPDNRPHAGAA